MRKAVNGAPDVEKRERRPISTKQRYAIFDRDRFTCRYCGSKAPDVVLHVDHVVPHSRGGDNSHENLVTACSACNQGKADTMIGKATVTVPEKHPLEGWAFLSYEMKDGGKYEVLWQGVIRNVFDGMALVDFFSWFTGDYTNSALIPLSAFAEPEYRAPRFFKLFGTVEERNDWYEHRECKKSAA